MVGVCGSSLVGIIFLRDSDCHGVEGEWGGGVPEKVLEM